MPVIAVIGCGAIAENFHLPALTRDEFSREQAVLVDVDGERAQALAQRFGIPRIARDYTSVLPELDGAIVAVPPRLHAPVVSDCLESGVHVLCEKPLAESLDTANRLVRQAKSAGVRLAVNNTMRLHPAVREVRRRIREGNVGEVRSVGFKLGEEFDWPAASDAYFGRKSGGRGILQDKGAHVLDLVCWWLGGKPALERYTDDSFGGSEAVADVQLAWQNRPIHVRLSWLTKLANEFQIVGTAETLTGEIYEWNRLHVAAGEENGGPLRLRPKRNERDFAEEMVANFFEVCRGTEEPLVPGSDVTDSIALIEECYERRERFDLPWIQRGSRPSEAQEIRA